MSTEERPKKADVDAKVDAAIVLLKEAGVAGMSFDDLMKALHLEMFSGLRSEVSEALNKLGWPDNGSVVKRESNFIFWDAIAAAEHVVSRADWALHQAMRGSIENPSPAPLSEQRRLAMELLVRLRELGKLAAHSFADARTNARQAKERARQAMYQAEAAEKMAARANSAIYSLSESLESVTASLAVIDANVARAT